MGEQIGRDLRGVKKRDSKMRSFERGDRKPKTFFRAFFPSCLNSPHTNNLTIKPLRDPSTTSKELALQKEIPIFPSLTQNTFFAHKLCLNLERNSTFLSSNRTASALFSNIALHLRVCALGATIGSSGSSCHRLTTTAQTPICSAPLTTAEGVGGRRLVALSACRTRL